MKLICSQARDALKTLDPPPDLNIWQWAEKYRRLGKDVTAEPGRYRTDFAPYQREPQESFIDPEVSVTVLWWASRLGKTEILNNLDGWVIDTNPMNILVCYPTLDSAKKWSKQFFVPMVRSTRQLHGKIRDPRSRDANNTILSKQFPGGVISAIGANSPSGFRQVQAPVVKCDEIDSMEDGPEGDPVELAFKRADNYADCIQVLSSTATIRGHSRIESWYEASDKRKWFCPCPKCKKHQVLMFAQVRWPKDQPERAVYVCEHCKAELSDAQRVKMVCAGEWRPTAEFTGIRGYWLNAFNTTFPPKKGYKTKLHQLVSEFLRAKRKSKFALQVWTNTVANESWEDETMQKIEANPIFNRREQYESEVPRGTLLITAGVDVQDDRIEAEKVGWGLGEECWGIEHRIFLGSPTTRQPWEELDAWLTAPLKHPSGIDLRVACACIDSGHHTKHVYEFCRTRQVRRVFAVKGSAGNGMPLVSRPKKSGVTRVALYQVGTDTAKELLFSRLALEQAGPGYMHWPIRDCYDLEYFEQLTAEKAVPRWSKGQRVKVWEKQRDRNEALDIRVYATAAFALRPPISLERLNEQVNGQKHDKIERADDEDEPDTKTFRNRFNRTTGRRRGGWMKGY